MVLSVSPVHAAVIAINEALDRDDVKATAAALRNRNAALSDLQGALEGVYHGVLLDEKRRKGRSAAARVRSDWSIRSG